jgi:hypothetical protein
VVLRRLIIVTAIMGFAHSAHAHGIAGNRFFPGTLSFDDPAVGTNPYCRSFQAPSTQVKGAMWSIRDLEQIQVDFTHSLHA